MKADFFDVKRHLADPHFAALLKIYPHKLRDLYDNILSFNGTPNENESWEESPIIVEGGVTIAKLSSPAAHQTVLKQMVELELENKIALTRLKMSSEKKEILAQDLGALLYLSENEMMGFTDLLERLMRLLRSHVLVEKVSVFGIYDGFTLEGLAAINPQGNAKESWKLDSASLAGIAAATRKPYHSEDPAKDPKFQAAPGANVPRNLVCHPIIHGSTLLGVLNVSNKILAAFSDEDMVVISRFAKIASHLIQKHYLKLKMESYAKDSDNLGKYLSSKIAKNVKTLDSVELGGVEKKVVCLFIDIRSFTTITEGIKPSLMIKLLNFYFERLTAVIEKHEGTVDKIVGDLIMAVWNMPHDQPNPELLAVKCAIEMQKEMRREVAPYWQEHGGVEEMGGGIGINAGTAVVGNLGSSRFMNYTVIGDTINTAQRLEAQAEAGEIWVAECIFPMVDGKVEKPIRIQRGIHLKGKEQTVNAYVFKPLNFA